MKFKKLVLKLLLFSCKYLAYHDHDTQMILHVKKLECEVNEYLEEEENNEN